MDSDKYEEEERIETCIFSQLFLNERLLEFVEHDIRILAPASTIRDYRVFPFATQHVLTKARQFKFHSRMVVQRPREMVAKFFLIEYLAKILVSFS